MRLAALSAIVLVLAVTPASAGDVSPMKPDAKVLLDEGLTHFEKKDYAAALASFRKGHAIDPHRDFLYAMAQAERLSEDCVSATEHYRAFLATSPPDNEAGLARENLAKCDAVKVEPPVTSPVEPPPPTLVVPPPVEPVKIEPPKVEPKRPIVAREPPRPLLRDPLWITTTTFGAVGAALGIFGLTVGEVAAQDATEAQSYDYFIADRDKSLAFRIAGGVGLGVGLVAGVASIIRAATYEPPEDAPKIGVAIDSRAGFFTVELPL